MEISVNMRMFETMLVAYATARWGLVVAYETGCICNHQATRSGLVVAYATTEL